MNIVPPPLGHYSPVNNVPPRDVQETSQDKDGPLPIAGCIVSRYSMARETNGLYLCALRCSPTPFVSNSGHRPMLTFLLLLYYYSHYSCLSVAKHVAN